MTFKVHIESSGREFIVATGESIIDAAVRQGIMLPYGCRNGVCGACKGRVVMGRVDYGAHSAYTLSEQDKIAGMALFCKAMPLTDITIEPRSLENGGQNITVKRLPCRVEKMERLAPDVMRLYLKLPNTERLHYMAGQYLDIVLRDGRRRSFSMASAPSLSAQQDLIELHIAATHGGEFTGHVFGKMKEKDILRIEGPLGGFTLRKDLERPTIFLAAGTGFAPIKAMIEAELEQGIRCPMYFYWGATTRAGLYLESVVQGWVNKADNLKYVPVLSRPAAEDCWQGRQGYVQDAAVADFADLRDFVVYASGAPAMIDAARQACLKQGLPQEYFYFDAFEFASDGRSEG